MKTDLLDFDFTDFLNSIFQDVLNNQAQIQDKEHWAKTRFFQFLTLGKVENQKERDLIWQNFSQLALEKTFSEEELAQMFSAVDATMIQMLKYLKALHTFTHKEKSLSAFYFLILLITLAPNFYKHKADIPYHNTLTAKSVGVRPSACFAQRVPFPTDCFQAFFNESRKLNAFIPFPLEKLNLFQEMNEVKEQ